MLEHFTANQSFAPFARDWCQLPTARGRCCPKTSRHFIRITKPYPHTLCVNSQLFFFFTLNVNVIRVLRFI